MAKARKMPRRGLQFIVSVLRALARDPKVPGRVRLEAIDRLATIDQIYSVEVTPPSPETQTQTQKSVEEVLAEWKSKMGGDHATKLQSGSAASSESRR